MTDRPGSEQAGVERALREALRVQGESYTVSPDAWERVRERADRRGGRRPGSGRRPRAAVPVLAAAAVAATAAAITLVPSHLPGGGGDDRHRAVPLAPGGRSSPPGAAFGPPEVARALARLCADSPLSPDERARLLAEVHALRAPTRPGGPRRWFVAVEDGAGGLRLQGLTEAGRRLTCRSYTAAAPRGRDFLVDFSGERGAGEVSWVGFTAAAAVSFEAAFSDGTRMTFRCGAGGRSTANCGRIDVGRRKGVALFATQPRQYVPQRPGARVSGVLNLRDSAGKVVGRHPFAR